MNKDEFVEFLKRYNKTENDIISTDNILSVIEISKSFGDKIKVVIIRRIFFKTETYETTNMYDEGWRTVDCNELSEQTYYFDRELFFCIALSKDENDMIINSKRIKIEKQIKENEQKILSHENEIKESKIKLKRLYDELKSIK